MVADFIQRRPWYDSCERLFNFALLGCGLARLQY